jgi:hypothetical protein
MGDAKRGGDENSADGATAAGRACRGVRGMVWWEAPALLVVAWITGVSLRGHALGEKTNREILP